MTVRTFSCAIALLSLAASIAACSGNGTSSTPLPNSGGNAHTLSGATAAVMASTPTPMPNVVLKEGETVGQGFAFNPPRGDTASGGNGQAVDGLICNPTMYNNHFHVHSFVGLIVNGAWLALPDSIGLYKPGPLVHGFVNKAQCFYYVHTHDASGMVHQESPSTQPLTTSEFTLGNLMDIWGQALTPTQFGPYTGTVKVYYHTPPFRTMFVKGYKAWTADPKTLPLYSHTTIWIEVGPPFVPPQNLPGVSYYTYH